MTSPAKLIVDQLISDFQSRPNDFTITEYRVVDTKTKFEYWIANGSSFARIASPYAFRFGFIQGFRFVLAVNKLKAWKMLELANEQL